ncbi:hypothetical protein [Methanobrevibacter sp. DSM 116169]|uniref:hypothetical protein n=1 Tax=Methanobrevibacter sp. DSM 116169 TaxID=3242727 RepID=UPI0038FC8F25
MNFLWFYIAVALAFSDIIHSHIMWRIFNNFYILLAGLIHNTVHSPLQTWIIHELIEAIFHFCVISLLFFSFKIGMAAAFIHFVIDVSHTILIRDLPPIPHRALHFVIESAFFMLIYGL